MPGIRIAQVETKAAFIQMGDQDGHECRVHDLHDSQFKISTCKSCHPHYVRRMKLVNRRRAEAGKSAHEIRGL